MTGPVAVILAGGAARRMGGGDKGLRPLGTSTVLGHVVARLAPQVAALAINANGDADRFAAFALPVVADPVAGLPGPLAGVLAAMDWAMAQGADAVVTVAGDVPFVPCDLIPRLMLAAEGTGMAIAASGGRWHPVCALWPVAARDAVADALERGERKVAGVAATLAPGVADWPETEPDGFFNVNTQEDLSRAEAWACSTAG